MKRKTIFNVVMWCCIHWREYDKQGNRILFWNGSSFVRGVA